MIRSGILMVVLAACLKPQPPQAPMIEEVPIQVLPIPGEEAPVMVSPEGSCSR